MLVKLTEFSDILTCYTADFVGRECLVNQLDALLDHADCCFVVPACILGLGKTAFIRRVWILEWVRGA